MNHHYFSQVCVFFKKDSLSSFNKLETVFITFPRFFQGIIAGVVQHFTLRVHCFLFVKEPSCFNVFGLQLFLQLGYYFTGPDIRSSIEMTQPTAILPLNTASNISETKFLPVTEQVLREK
jgi:hypothetical protein